MEIQSQLIGSAFPDAGPLGAITGERPPGTLLVRTCRISARELRGLPSVWPRDELATSQVRAIRQDLRSGGDVLIPVVVRCEPGREDVVVDLIAGEHRVEAAFREGRPELTVQALVGTRSEALLWLLRESADPGTPRTILEQAWGIERWIQDSEFGGTQRALSVVLGMSESQVSELRKFARALPEDLVKGRSAQAGVPLCEIVQSPRSALRGVSQRPPDETRDILDKALANIKAGIMVGAAWDDALGTPTHSRPARPSPPTWVFRPVRWCRAGGLALLRRLALITEQLARGLVGILLGTLRSVRRPLLAAKIRLDARLATREAPANRHGRQKETAPETSPRESPQSRGPEPTSPRSTEAEEDLKQDSPRELLEPGPDAPPPPLDPQKKSKTLKQAAKRRLHKDSGQTKSSSASSILPTGAYTPG